jgi:predicted Zn-dependent protease
MNTTTLLDWTRRHYHVIADHAYLLQSEGHYREAAILFEGLLAATPSDNYCRTALSAIHLALGQWGESIQYTSIILESDPLNQEALARRCEAYLRLDRLTDADRDLQRLTQLRHSVYLSLMQRRLMTRRQRAVGQ